VSRRPINEKKLRRLKRQLRKNASQVQSLIDLRDWLRSRGYADTTGQADQIILAKRVMVDSHPLGIERVLVKNEKSGILEARDVVQPLVAADLGPKIVVKAAE
jgi:hypothetical protein